MTCMPHATVATIVEKDGKFLFVKEYADNIEVINQPAGHVEANESIIDASIRETLEESGWEVTPESLVGIYTYRPPSSDATYYRFCFASKANRQIEDYPIDTDIHGQCWLTPEELYAETIAHRSPLVSLCVRDYMDGKRYPLSLIYEHPKGS